VSQKFDKTRENTVTIHPSQSDSQPQNNLHLMSTGEQLVMTERNSKEQEFFQQNLGNMVSYMQSLQDGAKLQEQAEICHTGGENVNDEEEDESWPQPFECNLKH